MDTFLLKRGGVSCIVLYGYSTLLSSAIPFTWGVPQGFFWHIPVLLPGPLLVLSQDTISGREIFILPCEYTCEKHVYCTSGLLTQWNCLLTERNWQTQQSQLLFMCSPPSSGYKVKCATLKDWTFGQKAVLKESMLKEISRAVRAERSNM